MGLKQMRNKLNKDNLVVLYKLLNDLLFIEIVFFLLAIIGESILPGTDTSHMVFLVATILSGATILAIFHIGDKTGISLKNHKLNKKTAALLIFILIVFIFSSLLKINLVLNMIISLASVLSGYLIYKITFEDCDL